MAAILIGKFPSPPKLYQKKNIFSLFRTLIACLMNVLLNDLKSCSPRFPKVESNATFDWLNPLVSAIRHCVTFWRI